MRNRLTLDEIILALISGLMLFWDRESPDMWRESSFSRSKWLPCFMSECQKSDDCYAQTGVPWWVSHWPSRMCVCSLGYRTENTPGKRTSLRWGDDCQVRNQQVRCTAVCCLYQLVWKKFVKEKRENQNHLQFSIVTSGSETMKHLMIQSRCFSWIKYMVLEYYIWYIIYYRLDIWRLLVELKYIYSKFLLWKVNYSICILYLRVEVNSMIGKVYLLMRQTFPSRAMKNVCVMTHSGCSHDPVSGRGWERLMTPQPRPIPQYQQSHLQLETGHR